MVERKLTPKQTEKLGQIIKEQLDNLIFKGVYTSEEFNLLDEDRTDEVDFANATVSNSQRLRFRNRENFYAKKLSLALERIQKGIYGTCEECDGPIGFKRLQARPTAELCIGCKEEAEREESLSVIGRKSKSLGDQLQLATS